MRAVPWLRAVLALTSCGENEQAAAPAQKPAQNPVEEPAQEPDRVTIQHILIGFEGSVPGKPITRTLEEAHTLAQLVFEKARAGEDFDALVKQYTDDSHPGIYKMANHGVAVDRNQGIYLRSGMVPVFGNVGFVLKVAEVGLGKYDPQKSKYGWHIIKRLE